MANNKSFIALIFVLCLNLISTNIYAANVGGWTLGNPVAQGASTIYEGTKKVIIDGKDYIKKGTAKITPPASGVAKVLARGAAGYALSVAVEQLIGAVDWVLDPANNRVVYTNNPADFPADHPSFQYYYTVTSPLFSSYYKGNVYTSMNDVCLVIDGKYHSNVGTITFKYIDGLSCYYHPSQYGKDFVNVFASATRVANPAYDPSAENEDREKSIPLDVVAAQVISNAESGDTNAQVATTAAASDIVAEAEKDNTKARPIAQQLEASSQTKPADEAAAEKANEATGTSKPNTANPEATDLALEFPVFCGWAPLVCEAAQVVISFPQTLTNWWETGKTKAEEWALSISEAWTAAKEWATKEKDSEDTEVDVEELDLEAESVDINLASGCPAPVVFIDSHFYGQPFKIEFSFDGFCSILSDWVRPILISLGAFIAALILGGVKVNE